MLRLAGGLLCRSGAMANTGGALPDSTPAPSALELLFRDDLFRQIFGRERGDDFLEARIAAERIPNRIQTQFAVGWASRDFPNCYFEFLDGQVAFTKPRADPCQVGYKRRNLERLVRERHDFHRSPTFA